MNTDQPIHCPFCGAVDHRVAVTRPCISQYVVECRVCSAQGPPFDDAERAIALWNERNRPAIVKPAEPRQQLSPDDAKMLNELVSELNAIGSIPMWLRAEIEGGLEP